MKKITTAIVFLFLISFNASAMQLEAKALEDLLRSIEINPLTYRERGLVFGFNSIQSCLYTNKDFAILKNYCYPAQPYPAKGYTIISAKYGVIELYQERLDNGVNKRDVTIDVFPAEFADYAGTSTQTVRIAKLNSILEDIYKRRTAACWSTNYSWYTETADVKCNEQAGANIVGFESWSRETQTATRTTRNWNRVMNRVEAALKR